MIHSLPFVSALLAAFTIGTGTLYAGTPVPPPVVLTPANGSTTGDPTPDVTGTAPGNATITVFLDGAVAGTAAAGGSGDWTFTAPTDLSLGSHTVRARATDGGGNTSASSNTNTFRVIEPPSLVVTTTSDASTDSDLQTSLREALAYAAQFQTPKTIGFSNSTAGGAENFYDGAAHTIALGGTQLVIASSVTIIGPGANRLAISGSQASRVLSVDPGKTVTLAGFTIKDGNRSSPGAGIYNQGALTVRDCTISGNSSTNGHAGGGLFNENGAFLTIQNCTVSGNTAEGDSGGGIYNTATLTIRNCTVTGNSADLGGGIESGGKLTIQNSTITGNAAVTNGVGGGIHSNASTPVTLENSIVAGNTASRDPDISASAALASNGHNFLGTSNAGAPTDQTFASTGKTLADLLETEAGVPVLKDNAGPTFTIALVPGSPALDAGDPAFDPVTFTPPLTTDQRGAPFSRVRGTALDIGAYEAQPINLVVSTASDEDDGDYQPGHLSLREALQAARGSFGAATVTFADERTGGHSGGTVNFFDGTPHTIAVAVTELPRITKSLTLTGPGAALLTITVSGISPQGIFNVEGTSETTITGLTISGNRGPGVFCAGSLTVTDCVFSGNGGANVFHFGTTLTATSCTFSGSKTGLLADGDSATLNACTFDGNDKEGIFGGESVQLSAVNCTFGNNFIGVRTNSTASATLTHCTISGNPKSGLDTGVFTVRNTLCAGNGANGTANTVGTITDGGGNLLTGTAAQAGLEVDSNGAPVLKNNGGPTKTFRLLSGSIAIDAGDNALAVDAAAHTLTTDQRGAGFPRILRGQSAARVDIGAFEYKSLVADDLAFSTGKKAIDIDVLANDDMRNGVTLTIVTPPAHGTATVVNGKIHYVPNTPLPLGGDTFTYRYDDGHGGSGTATVTITHFAGIAGTYDGLIEDPTATTDAQAHQRAGWLRVTITRTGSFSGQIIFAGQKLSPIFRTGFRGYGFGSLLASGGDATRILLRRPSAPITLTLQYDPANHAINGAAASTDSSALAFTSPFTLAAQTPTSTLAGSYVLQIAPGVAPDPTGPGKAATYISAQGAIRITGRLGDGAPFSSATSLHDDESFAIYSGLYTGPAPLLGSLRGTMQFPLIPSPHGDATGTLEWFKPARPRDRLFPAGFDVSGHATLTR